VLHFFFPFPAPVLVVFSGLAFALLSHLVEVDFNKVLAVKKKVTKKAGACSCCVLFL